jgi:hypothetical protein
MTYPTDDQEFEDVRIDGVERQSDGTFAIACDGWHFWCGKECLIAPRVGQVARKYGRGIGSPVRGLFIDGEKIWYRTEAEEKEHSEIAMYGADAADWLSRWDAGKTVWSIEMGGLGPGYEQCIHITAAEVLRWLIANHVDVSLWDDASAAKPIFDRMDKIVSEVPSVRQLGLSGAQWGAAVSLASMLYRKGPRAVMADPRLADRKIQVCRYFPGETAA